MVFLRVTTICSTTSLGGEIKPSAQCRNIFRHVEHTHNVKEILTSKVHGHFCQVSPASILGVSAGYCQTALVGESGIIRTQMGKHNRSVMVAVCVWDALCDTTP